MKRVLVLLTAAALLVAAVTGCSKEDAAKARDGFTGKTAVTQGEAMKAKINTADSLLKERAKLLDDIE